jgi:hypothetical protein
VGGRWSVVLQRLGMCGAFTKVCPSKTKEEASAVRRSRSAHSPFVVKSEKPRPSRHKHNKGNDKTYTSARGGTR